MTTSTGPCHREEGWSDLCGCGRAWHPPELLPRRRGGWGAQSPPLLLEQRPRPHSNSLRRGGCGPHRATGRPVKGQGRKGGLLHRFHLQVVVFLRKL